MILNWNLVLAVSQIIQVHPYWPHVMPKGIRYFLLCWIRIVFCICPVTILFCGIKILLEAIGAISRLKSKWALLLLSCKWIFVYVEDWQVVRILQIHGFCLLCSIHGGKFGCSFPFFLGLYVWHLVLLLLWIYIVNDHYEDFKHHYGLHS